MSLRCFASAIMVMCCQFVIYSQVSLPMNQLTSDRVSEILFENQQKQDIAAAPLLTYAVEYDLVETALLGILGQPNKTVNIKIDFKNTTYELNLDRKFLTVPSYKLTSAVAQEESNLNAYYYRGIIQGMDGWVTMAIINGNVRLLIAHSGGNIEILKQGEVYVGYESKDRKEPLTYSCDADDSSMVSVSKKSGSDARYGSDCLELYLECDHQSYLANSSSVAQTEAWALSLFNDVSAIYNTANLPLVVESIFVHNAPDPYVSFTDKAAVRNAFVDEVAGNQTARVGYLLSTRDLNGGISYGIGGLCGVYPAFPGPFAVATSLSSTLVPYPSYSFNTHVIAHELGHVLGARHTHACVWNGDDSQIDDCGNVWAAQQGFTPEGGQCFEDQSPILPSTGTIMSLCDLVSGIGVNLANGFSTELENLIFDNYDNALCSTGGQCASIPPSNDDCSGAITLTPKRFCVAQDFDNIMATSSLPTSSSCGAVSDLDVWFNYASTGNFQRVTIDFSGGGLQDVLAIAYSGSCGSLTELSCLQSSSQSMTLIVPSVAAGQQIYIRLIETNDIEGLFSICIQDSSTPCHPYETELVSLYNSTGGANWGNNEGWASTITSANCDVCQWYGITCDKNDNIIELDLSFNNLVGTIPSSLELITTLRKVDLFSNSLTGPMPDVWSGMSGLEYLDLSSNSFSGLIPRSVLDLEELQTLYLENNNLQDTLPKELGLLASIDVMWLKNNNLTGCFPATFANICNISSKTFTGNAGLPGSGDFAAFCDQGIGSDADFDGFCSGSGVLNDCDDDDDSIYPNAQDVCDGKDNNCDGDIDEGSVMTVSWVGANGSWGTASNWSSGQEPRACEDVVISGGRIVTVPIGLQAYARSVTIMDNSELVNLGMLDVSGSDDHGIQVEADATFTNNASISVDNISAIGLIVNGGFENNGSIFVRVLGVAPTTLISLGAQFENSSGQIIMGQQ